MIGDMCIYIYILCSKGDISSYIKFSWVDKPFRTGSKDSKWKLKVDNTIVCYRILKVISRWFLYVYYLMPFHNIYIYIYTYVCVS